MRRRGALLLAGTVVVAGISTATIALQDDSDRNGSIPTEAQARAALDAKFEQARSGDPETFCGDTDIPDMCKSQWQRLGGRDGVPEDKPRVISTREQDGYRVLRVCGTDGQGRPYRTDFVVGLDQGEIAYVLPVFWNGATFSGVHGDDTGRVDQAQTPSAESCP